MIIKRNWFNILTLILALNSSIFGSYFLKLTQNDVNKITQFDNTCTICLKKDIPTKKLYKITCKSKIPHFFCKDCCQSLISYNIKQCPHCRTQIELIDQEIVNIYELLMKAYRKHQNIKEHLTSIEIPIDLPDKLGKTILMNICLDNRDLNLIKFLIHHGANPNTQDIHGKTALMYACQNGEIEVIKLLIALKADTTIKDINQKTAFMHIEGTTPNKHEILQLFIQKKRTLKKRLNIIRRNAIIKKKNLKMARKAKNSDKI